MENVLCMNAGEGELSYAQNSSFWQKSVLLITKSILEESIRSWKTLFECDKLLIADLGCSSGPNTLLVTQLIATEIRNKYAERGITVPEFQIFFNDLPSTDFNSLFRLLSAAPPMETPFYVAGVPGSFHKRLFPVNSLHFVHSCYGLHWLSRVPPEVEDKNSKCWNKGRIYISEQGPAGVWDAYFAQFQKDFNGFLRARAMEIVKGGRMFVAVNGRLSADRKHPGTAAVYWDWLASAIQDLISQKFIEEEKLNSFNLPFYAPSSDELRSEVNKEGSFTIVGLELIIGQQRNIENNDDIEKGKFISKQTRAIVESLISYHFGEEMVDVIFNRYAEILATNIMHIEEVLYKQSTTIVLILERNVST